MWCFKKLVAVFGSLAIISSLVVPNSAIAATKPKPGAACSKLASTSVLGKVRYTCVKKGKKLIWDSGKPVAPAPVKSVPASPETTQKPSLDMLDTKAVYDTSRAEVWFQIARNSAVATNVKYFVGKNVEESMVSLIKKDLASAIGLWATKVTKDDDVSVIWYTQPDLEWAKSKYLELTDNPISASNINSSCTLTYCGGATATVTNKGALVFEQGMKHNPDGWNRSTSAHEYTHLAQYKTSNRKVYAMPLWLKEGSAQFYGEAVGYSPLGKQASIRRGMHTQFARDAEDAVATAFNGLKVKEVLAAGVTADAVKIMTLLEARQGNSSLTGLAYLLGSYASEVLVAVYGQEKMVELYESFSTSENWEANFSKVYGVSTAHFYGKLAPYFKAISAELE